MRAALLTFCLALALAAPAHGAVEPAIAKNDPRIRVITYDQDSVVTIYGKVGISTLILFEKDEELYDMVGGDTAAWGAASTKARNGITVKPIAKVAVTNIQVITSRRVYNFDMKLAPKDTPGFLMVRFRYPVIERAEADATREKEKVQSLLDAPPVGGNRNYTVQGSSSLQPIEAWDDGTSTYFRFAANASLPVIYGARASDDKLERIENVSVTPGDVVQVPGVRPKFVFRIGRQVACVFNEGYDPKGARPATNTVSPHVKRITKGATP